MLPTSKRLGLPDGRTLAWTEFGATDGRPVLYCHGTPGSRLEAAVLDADARARGLSIIACDRPGYGDSSPRPGRSISSAGADLVALVNHLGLKRYALLAVSGGAPYALALAQSHPERVRAVALVCPLGPPTEPVLARELHASARFAFRIARRHPVWLPGLVARPHAWLIGRSPMLALRILRVAHTPADRQVLSRPEVVQNLCVNMAMAMRQQGAGLSEDLTAAVAPWPIDYARVTAPVRIWHGSADRLVHAAHARWLAARLPQARLTLLPDEGHFSLPYGHAAQVLDALA